MGSIIYVNLLIFFTKNHFVLLQYVYFKVRYLIHLYRYSNPSDSDLIKISYVGVNNIDLTAVSSMVIEIILNIFFNFLFMQ